MAVALSTDLDNERFGPAVTTVRFVLVQNETVGQYCGGPIVTTLSTLVEPFGKAGSSVRVSVTVPEAPAATGGEE